MKDQFVTYEIAEKLKILGFNEPCLMYFRQSGGGLSRTDPELVKTLKTTNAGLSEALHNNWITLPLWQQAIDWLREKRGLNISITPTEKAVIKNSKSNCLKSILDADFEINGQWQIDIELCKIGGESKNFYSVLKNSYEQAREAAILKALELITK